MRIDLDSCKEILDTITRNKTRSLLTGFGVFWGVFMLVGLIGGGQGLKELLQQNFAGFATNSALIWTQETTKPFKGFRKGRSFSLVRQDIERLRQQIPELDVITPLMFYVKNVVSADRNFNASIMGVSHDYKDIYSPIMVYGRYLNSIDIAECRKVCVIGKQVYQNLFPNGGNPCGQRIRIDSTYYQVVGVDYKGGEGININGRADEQVSMPYTTFCRAYNCGDNIHGLALTARNGVVMSSITDRMRMVIARSHTIDPTDDKAIVVFNTEVLFAMVDNLFRGVNFLIWLVGIGTLLAGAIGVSNIMMVTVRERTTEIGIRRAIGATPRMILTQIMAESIALTSVAGMSGILFAVVVLQMVEVGNTSDGILTAHFQVPFSTALLATILLSCLGGLAGLLPALRAMQIKPVEAMREE